MEKNKARPKYPKVEKSRHWAFGLYSESAKEGWREILKAYAVPFVVSPLHNKDVYEEDKFNEDGTIQYRKGETKKPHWHIQFAFNNPTTERNMKAISESVGGTKGIINLKDPKTYYEYLWHKNDHDKYQYDEADVEHYSGFSVANFGLSVGEVDSILRRLTLLSLEKGWVDYDDLICYLIKNEMNADYSVARGQTRYFTGFFIGRWRKKKRAMEGFSSSYDNETTEKEEVEKLRRELMARTKAWKDAGSPENYSTDPVTGEIVTYGGLNSATSKEECNVNEEVTE